MTYSEMKGIPTPSYLMPGNMIQFSIRALDEFDEEFDGIGMITESDHDYYGDENCEFRVEAVRYCLKLQCGDGMVRNTSLYYTRVDNHTSPLAAQFDDGIYEPDEDLNGGPTLIIHEVFEC